MLSKCWTICTGHKWSSTVKALTEKKKKRKVFFKKTRYLLKNNKGHWKRAKMKEKDENAARERAASWAVWGWERCTLPGTLMNALQASSLPRSPQRCGFHAFANHALWDTTAQSWWKETRNTVSISNWLHLHKIHTLHSYIVITTTKDAIVTVAGRNGFLH